MTDEAIETRVKLLEDHECGRQRTCDAFHTKVYDFMNYAGPHVDTWAGFKKWAAMSLLAFILLAAGGYSIALDIRFRLAAIEAKVNAPITVTDVSPAVYEALRMLSFSPPPEPPREGAKPVPPVGYKLGRRLR